MRFFLIIVLIIALTGYSCRKKKITVAEEPPHTSEMKKGLPENPKAINGYLYASYARYQNGQHYYFHGYSTFSDPARNLLMGYNHFFDQAYFVSVNYYGNVDVGAVMCNNAPMSKNTFSPNITYSFGQQSFTGIAKGTSWITEGNRSFSAIDVTPVNTFPVLSVPDNTVTVPPIKKSVGLTVDLTGVASDYDSLIVAVIDGAGNYSVARKAFGPGATQADFTPADFKLFSTGTSYGSLVIYAFNYSHQTIRNRLYLFELSHKISRNVLIEP
ncbi:MAG: hypothetical protein K0S12_865 [Bacteroidetes bacterium]|jgi:hypothetical protein|nr:hypothetical protein [Bacteroidota bacterium]